MSSSQQVHSPFSKDQVLSLNEYQKAGFFHAFTCGECRDNFGDAEYELVATRRGWICPTCTYIQDWAWEWMSDWSWKELQAGMPSEFKTLEQQVEALRTEVDTLRAKAEKDPEKDKNRVLASTGPIPTDLLQGQPVPADLPWHVRPWPFQKNQCKARLTKADSHYHGRCELRAGHSELGIDHAIDRGFQTIRWMVQWS